MITTHVLDIARGGPAVGVTVILELRQASEWTPVGRGSTDEKGRVLTFTDGPISPGAYRLTFDVADYQRDMGMNANFFPEVEFRPIGSGTIGRLVVGDGRCDGLRFTELVDLNDPRHHGALCRLPDEPRSKSRRQDQIAEGDEAPVSGLHASGADAVVPYLSRPLIGRLGRGCLAVADGRTPKQIHL